MRFNRPIINLILDDICRFRITRVRDIVVDECTSKNLHIFVELKIFIFEIKYNIFM